MWVLGPSSHGGELLALIRCWRWEPGLSVTSPPLLMCLLLTAVITWWCSDCYTLFLVILTSFDGSIIISAVRNPPHLVCRQWLHLTPFSSCCRKLEVGPWVRECELWWGGIQDVGSGCNGSISRRENMAVKETMVTNERGQIVQTNQSEAKRWGFMVPGS